MRPIQPVVASPKGEAILSFRLIPLLLILPVLVLAEPTSRKNFDWKTPSLIAVQERGRLKPFDTFAREAVQYVTGRAGWNDMSPTEVLFGWLFAFEKDWESVAFVKVGFKPLKEHLKLNTEQSYFSPRELSDLSNLNRLAATAQEKQARKEKLTDLEKNGSQLQNQLALIDAVVTGRALTILPNPHGISEDWMPLTLLTKGEQLPYSTDQMKELSEVFHQLVQSYLNTDAQGWEQATVRLSSLLRNSLSGGHYPSESTLVRETHYNHLRPFRWAWILYTAAFLVLITFHMTQKRGFKIAGLSLMALGYAVHTYGFILRVLIAGRPPVTNMYESVIWVSWGCLLFSWIILAFYRNAVILTAASAFSVVALVLADNLPSVLDPNIHPLEPVLRSNFWLTIHVLTITLSYAAFSVSLCLGNTILGNFIFTPQKTERINALTLYMYRAMQIGVVLLAAGTILGGVWADYSWGRFWGWDPKEVWALIALLVYLAILHGRYASWLKGFGFVAGTVLCFLAVLMAWYGVNFVLGVGLHSYGFGSGGLFWVSLYIALQVIFIILSYIRYASFVKI